MLVITRCRRTGHHRWPRGDERPDRRVGDSPDRCARCDGTSRDEACRVGPSGVEINQTSREFCEQATRAFDVGMVEIVRERCQRCCQDIDRQ